MRPSPSRLATIRTSASRSSCSDCELTTPIRRAPTIPAANNAAAMETDLSRRALRAGFSENGMQVSSGHMCNQPILARMAGQRVGLGSGPGKCDHWDCVCEDEEEQGEREEVSE